MKRLAQIFVGVWALAFLIVGASLMVGHWYVLPRPDADDPQLHEQLDSLRDEDTGWFAVHVLYSKCTCSRRVFEHLFEDPRPSGVAERIVLVGSDEEIERRAADRGFELRVVTPEALAREFHIESAPLLIIVAPDGTIRYAGGYTDRKQGYDVRDVGLLRALMEGKPTAELPLFGCGVSKDLQETLDPFSLKYG